MYSLAALDAAETFAPDPAIWEQNLAALRAEQPDIAQSLPALLPPHWRPVRALDGAETFRLDQPGDPPCWLDGSAAPRLRAEALLEHVPIEDGNPCLPLLGTGRELLRLLEILSVRQAVYVFEPDATRLAAVLHILRIADEIARGRCIFVPGSGENAFLEALLERWPGLAPPSMLVRLPGVAAERIRHVQAVCQQISSWAAPRRAKRLAALTARVQNRPAASQPQTLATIVLSGRPRHLRLASWLTSAAEAHGWTARAFLADSPRTADPLLHGESLAQLCPRVAVAIGHDGPLPPLPSGTIELRWHVDLHESASAPPAGTALHAAASPRIRRILTANGAPAGRVLDLWWPAHVPAPRSAPSGEPALVLLADRPDTRRQACGIEQPTHLRLWATLLELAAQRWERPEIASGHSLLRAAERACDVPFADDARRDAFVELIELRLIPAVVSERILQLLQEQPEAVWLVGSGWTDDPRSKARLLGQRLAELDPAVLPPVRAAVCSGLPDPLCEDLIGAAGRRWPLVLFAPAGRRLDADLGGMIRPDQDAEVFADGPGLRQALAAIRSEPERFRRRAERLAARLSEEHGWGRRLAELVEGLPRAGSPPAF